MRVDIWLPDINLAIEYDGEHHFAPANGGGEERLAVIRECDRTKDRLLSENGIPLIRVSGWPIDMQMLNYKIWKIVSSFEKAA